MNARRIKKLEDKLTVNLDYLRLQADVYAVESYIREAEQKSSETSIKEGFFEKVFNKIKKFIKVVAEQSSDWREKEAIAKKALLEFEGNHNEKELKLANAPEKLDKLINNKLFKKDKLGLKRVEYGLTYIISNKYEYQCYNDSLSAVSEILFKDSEMLVALNQSFIDNYKKMAKKEEVVLTEREFFKEIGIVIKNIVFSVFNIEKGDYKNDAEYVVSQVSQNQLAVEMAMYLTRLEKAKGVMLEEDFKKEIKQFLNRVSDIRKEAENASFIEKNDKEESEEKIRICNECLARLAEING